MKNIKTDFKHLPIELLHPCKTQPRKVFNEEALNELAASIKTQGIIEPLIVRPSNVDQFEIIAGERRWRAAMRANLHEIPCLIRNYSALEIAAVALIENIQRENLNLLEEADAYQRLVDEFHFSQDEIGILVGKSRSHITNILRLKTLTAKVKPFIENGQISYGHAKMLAGLEEPEQFRLAQKIVKEDWSVRRLELFLRQKKANKKNTSPISTQDLETRLSEYLGTPVEITLQSNQEGWLKIKFFDNDTLSGLLERIGLSYD